MNMLFFKYAVEIERTRSITKAAENLFMAQPNLSKIIRELEYEVGFSIFERTSRGVVPTPRGRDFLLHARKILDELRHINTLTGEENPERQSFSLSMPRSSYIADGFIRFVKTFDSTKEININIQETGSLQTVENIEENRFNLGIIRYQAVYENYYFDFLDKKNLAHEHLWEFEYLVLMSRRHPLAKTGELRFCDLKPFIEIIHGDTVVPYINAAELRYPSPEAVPVKRIYLYERCNQFDLLASLSQTYMWVSPVPDRLLERYDLVQRNCVFTNNRYKDALIYRGDYRFTPLDRRFLDTVFKTRDEAAAKAYR
jgi:DNA-binding transcriptional LysR family regulator